MTTKFSAPQMAGLSGGSSDPAAPQVRRPVKALMFDFDGTIFNTIPLIVESYQHVYRQFGLPEHSEAEILSGIGLPLETVFSEYGARKTELTAAYIAYNHAVGLRRVGLFTPAYHLLTALRQAAFPLAIVTAKRRSSLQLTLEQFGLEPYFEVVVCLEDTTAHKPDPEPLFCAMRKLGLRQAADLIYVGDAVYDIQAAHNGGFAAAAVSWTAMPPAELRRLQPEYWLDDTADFLSQIVLAR